MIEHAWPLLVPLRRCRHLEMEDKQLVGRCALELIELLVASFLQLPPPSFFVAPSSLLLVGMILGCWLHRPEALGSFPLACDSRLMGAGQGWRQHTSCAERSEWMMIDLLDEREPYMVGRKEAMQAACRNS